MIRGARASPKYHPALAKSALSADRIDQTSYPRAQSVVLDQLPKAPLRYPGKLKQGWSQSATDLFLGEAFGALGNCHSSEPNADGARADENGFVA